MQIANNVHAQEMVLNIIPQLCQFKISQPTIAFLLWEIQFSEAGKYGLQI